MPKPAYFFRILLLVCLACMARGNAQEEAFKKIKSNGADFVTLESFCEVYGFDPADISHRGPFELKSGGAVLEFEPGLRRMRFNGRRLWLSAGLIEDDKGRLLVAELDLVKTLDPLLRPENIRNREPVKGVVVDAGHGGQDAGAYGRGMYEKNATLDTSQRLFRILKEKEIPVLMTRSSDLFLELAERASMANDHPGYIFISIHYNTGPKGSHGVETFAMTPQYAKSTGDEARRVAGVRDFWPGNGEDSKNILLAWLVHNEIAGMHSKEGDRGVKRARFKVLRESEIPGILVEAGFLTHPADSKLISSQEYREKVALGIAHAIEAYMQIMDPSRKPPELPAPAPEAEAPAGESPSTEPPLPEVQQPGQPDPAAQAPEVSAPTQAPQVP
jgi:N-acetylmuramoyl-L-alanine amidase